MKDVSRQLIVPAFLFFCLVLGGSQQSIWGLLALQLTAIFLIGWGVMSPATEKTGATGLLVLLLAALLLIVLQLVPLPPALWTLFPGRQFVEDGYRLLGHELPWQPISLTPYSTLESFLLTLPPLAVILAVLRIRAYRETWVALALFAGTIAGILLGYMQVVTGQFGRSEWYLYEHTNVGSAVGFFANRNHMGTLLLMAFPFLVALFFGSPQEDARRATSLGIIGAVGVVVFLLGIAVNGSLAAVVLAVPVIVASALLVPRLRRFRALIGVAAAMALMASLIFLANSPVQPKLTGETTASFGSRWEIWQRTWEAIEDTFPVGTGWGSFEAVYAALEPPKRVSPTYVNHAHNDYLQLILEAGFVGVLLAIAFFFWWIRRVARIFSRPQFNSFAGAAAIGSGAALAHSAVDYPLRTTAIAATFAFCLAVMAMSRSRFRREQLPHPPEFRPARHVKLG